MFTVTLVGRPNVGKSSLFNALLGYRRTMVLDIAGTTTDVVAEVPYWGSSALSLEDSQGIFSENDRGTLKPLIESADALLFVVDAICGLTPFDLWIAREVQLSNKPCLLVVNKVDHKNNAASEFFELGFDEVTEASAAHRKNIDSIRQWILGQAGDPGAPKMGGEKLKVALVGRPNTGKSTLMNTLSQQTISRVSPTPLTTRDPVSFELESTQGVVRLLDTAGIRRPRSQKNQIEVFSIQASVRAIREADVIFLLIASHEPITDQDMRLLNLVERTGKPAVVLLNFWDLLSSFERKHFLKESEFAAYLKQFRTLSISAREKLMTGELLPMAFRLKKQAAKRVKTSHLNQLVEKMVSRNPPPMTGNQNFNILYASQVKASPPTFVFFLNRKGALPASYRKYLENQLRERLGLRGQPIRIFFQG